MQHRVIGGRSLLDRLPMGAEETTSRCSWSPRLLAFTMWLLDLCDGPGSVRPLLQRTFQWRIGLGGWLLVIAGLPAATVALGLVFGRELVTADLPIVVAKGFGTLALLVLVVNLWEETIWAGFVQTRLERRHRARSGCRAHRRPVRARAHAARVRRRTVLRRCRGSGSSCCS